MTEPARIFTTTTMEAAAHCASCSGAVTLQFSEGTDGESSRQRWTCPYCRQDNTGSFPRKIAWATRPFVSDVDCSPEEMADRIRPKMERFRRSDS